MKINLTKDQAKAILELIWRTGIGHKGDHLDVAYRAIEAASISESSGRKNRIIRLAKGLLETPGQTEVDESDAACILEVPGKNGAWVSATIWISFKGTNLDMNIPSHPIEIGTRVCIINGGPQDLPGEFGVIEDAVTKKKGPSGDGADWEYRITNGASGSCVWWNGANFHGNDRKIVVVPKRIFDGDFCHPQNESR